MGEALCPATVAKYKKVWVELYTFMSAVLHLPSSFPVQPEVIVMLLLKVHEQESQLNTIKQKMSALLFNLHRLEDPCKDNKVKIS